MLSEFLTLQKGEVLESAADVVQHLGYLGSPACQLVRKYSYYSTKRNQVKETYIVAIWDGLYDAAHQVNNLVFLLGRPKGKSNYLSLKATEDNQAIPHAVKRRQTSCYAVASFPCLG